MTSALGIASVSAVLVDLLNNGLIDHDVASSVGEVTVTALPPDRVAAGQSERSQLNLFLYQTASNPGWRNVGLPSRGERGEPRTNPPLAVDLYYLLTAYGARDFHAEILLGYGMQLLHEHPVLARDAIRRSLADPTPVTPGSGLPTSLRRLATSGLADQVELIKICPHPMSLDDVSKLWSAFQTGYRPSSAFLVSVVLIEGTRSTSSSLPVRQPLLYVAPTRQQPHIDQVNSVDGPDRPILAESRVVITGARMRGAITSVAVGSLTVIPAPEDISDTQIEMDLPAGLQAGVQGIQVVHQVALGLPPQPHRGPVSNLAAFVLRPSIGSVGLTDSTGSGDSPRAGNVQLTVAPPVGQRQRVVLLLNQMNTATPQAYSFIAPERDAATGTLTVPINDVAAGDYLVRIQVDGAESPLALDTDPASPTFNQYIAPALSIP